MSTDSHNRLAMGTLRVARSATPRWLDSAARLAGALAVLNGCEGGGSAPSGVDISAIDRSIDPCQDFYSYACGGWIAAHPLPPDASGVRRFDDPFYTMVPTLRDIIEKDAAGARASDDPQAELIGNYYQSCLRAPSNVALRDEANGMVAAIMAIQSLDDLARQVAVQRNVGSGTFFSSGVTVNLDTPTEHTVLLDQGGTELARHYYVDPNDAGTLQAYRAHIADLAAFFPGAQIDPGQVVAFETSLAQAELAPVDRGDPRALHHRMSIADLNTLAPMFPWLTYFQSAGFGDVQNLDVAVPGFISATDHLMATTPLPTLKMYMAWQWIQDKASRLDDQVVAANFNFWGPIRGAARRSSRGWECYTDTVERLGMAVAQPYVTRHFSAQTRQDVRDLVARLKGALALRMSSASWLDASTLAEATAKLEAIAAKVGYPDVWPSFGSLQLASGGSYLDNDLRLASWWNQTEAAMLANPVDRTLWSAAPTLVNAFYSRAANDITLPAAILQLPFFAPGFAIATNTGAIGAVIGHELTHGFDDAGRQFDATGALRDWWSPDTEAAFGLRAQCLADQYSRYQVLPGLNVDGELTLHENIADLGGIRAAYDALASSGFGERAGGFDGQQQFFLSFAQMYCENTQPAYTAILVATDRHSPAHVRVNGTLANVPEFAHAFGCPVGTPLAPEVACSVW